MEYPRCSVLEGAAVTEAPKVPVQSPPGTQGARCFRVLEKLVLRTVTGEHAKSEREPRTTPPSTLRHISAEDTPRVLIHVFTSPQWLPAPPCGGRSGRTTGGKHGLSYRLGHRPRHSRLFGGCLFGCRCRRCRCRRWVCGCRFGRLCGGKLSTPAAWPAVPRVGWCFLL